MAQHDTFILRAALDNDAAVYRDIEIEPTKSLYQLAAAIVSAFDFDLDHCFGFYTGLTPAEMLHTDPKYELFADIGEAEPGSLSVKKTKIAQAFPAVGHTLLFLFDYGDEWLFRVKLREQGKKGGKTRYPRIVAAQGKAPSQYEYPEDEEEPAEARRLSP
jgi:hypothetical protein